MPSRCKTCARYHPKTLENCPIAEFYSRVVEEYDISPPCDSYLKLEEQVTDAT
jgi:hypothetical protein